MQDDFSKYELMKQSGASAEQVYLEAARDKIDNITRIRLVRKVFSLSLEEYKEVRVRAEKIADSLQQHQENMVRVVREHLTKHPKIETVTNGDSK
jgi:hypothetical protein